MWSSLGTLPLPLAFFFGAKQFTRRTDYGWTLSCSKKPQEVIRSRGMFVCYLDYVYLRVLNVGLGLGH